MWASGSSGFRPPNFCFKCIVFLAIGSVALLLHRYYNILLFILFALSALIANTLLRWDAFESMNVFIKIVFPFRDSVLDDNMFMCFSIFSMVLCQFIWLAFFKSSLKYIPRIFVVSNCSLTVTEGVISWICFVLSVFIGSRVVFSKLIVAPVALFRFLKNVSTFFTDSWLFTKKLESSAYCEMFICSFWFGIFIPVIVLSCLTL